MRVSKRSIPLLLTLLLGGNYVSTSAQVLQKGVITEISSGNTPIAGVAIMALNASPTDSDSNGHFQLNFSKAFPGDLLFMQEIYKKGFETVNESEINNWVLSGEEILNIVMARSGYLEESKRKYYRIGATAFQQRYQEVVEKLAKEKKAQRLPEQHYQQKIDSMNREQQEFSKKLNLYADKFARINRDKLNETEKEALLLIDEGRLEEAIQVYEEMQLMEKMTKKQETRYTAMQNLETLQHNLWKELKLLQENNAKKTHNQRIDSLFQVLTASFPNETSYQFAYARHLTENEKYEDALNIYNTILSTLTVAGDIPAIESLSNCLEEMKAIPALKESPKIAALEDKIRSALRLIQYKTTH